MSKNSRKDLAKSQITSQKNQINDNQNSDLRDNHHGISKEDQIKNQIINEIENSILQRQNQLRQTIHLSLEKIDSDIQKQVSELKQISFSGIASSENQQKHILTEKQFKFKESYLTEYFKIENYRTLYNMTVATLILLMLNLILTDYTTKNEIFDMETLSWCFFGIEKTILPWCVIFNLSLTIVPLTHYIIKYKIGIFSWAIVYSCILLTMLTISIRTCYVNELGLASAMIIQTESVRIGLKMHAYLRTKLLYCTENKYKNFVPKQYNSNLPTYVPEIDIRDKFVELKRFLYFFFSPTLIYRDSYIQAPKRDGKVIFTNFFNFLLSIYFGFILFKTFCKPQIIFFSQNINFSSFLQVMFQLMLPGTLSIILLFFGLLHSWLNGWAELLRFPDRTFYLDWWNSREFGTYYRKWNMVVHEWLYYYVYGDIVRFSLGKTSKTVASLVTFLISAVIHELILTCILGFFYPILFIIFSGPGILLIQHTKRTSDQKMNILFWILMYLGTSMILTMYLTEYYARHVVSDNKILAQWGVFAPIIPRTLYLL